MIRVVYRGCGSRGRSKQPLYLPGERGLGWTADGCGGGGGGLGVFLMLVLVVAVRAAFESALRPHCLLDVPLVVPAL